MNVTKADAVIALALARMTTAEKVGHLLLAAIPGPELDADTETTLRDCHIGGAVLFTRNVVSAAQLRGLTNALQAVCGRDGLPALIAADEEGGRVQRLRGLGASFPSAMALGAAGDPALAESVGYAIGEKLRVHGLNVALAPVTDVNVNPANPVIGTRSYGEDPVAVATCVAATVRGLTRAGVAATAKHFPGHGDTHLDSHRDLPTIPHGLDRLRGVELVPFRAAIAAGVPLVMTAHIRFPALDAAGLPATLSAPVLHGLLRDELGFAGVVISDAMTMRAIRDHYGVVEGCVRAVIAGNDLIEPLEGEREVAAALVAATESGRLSLARLDDAARRVLRLRHRLASQPAAGVGAVDSDAHRALVRTVAARSVTLLHAPPGILPLAPGAAVGVVEFALEAASQAEEGAAAAGDSPLLAAFQEQFPRARGVVVHAAYPDAGEIAAAHALAAGCAALVIGTRDADRFPAQADIRDALLRSGKPAVLLSLRAPYDLADMEGAALLATYGDHEDSLRVAAAICAGVLSPRGRLPVTVEPRFAVGHGLQAMPGTGGGGL